jgi:molybdate transport system ATP-binding protein
MNHTAHPLIELNQARVARSGQPLLRGVTWALLPGQHWAFLGGNGAGKTTLIKLLRGDIWPEPPAPGQPEPRVFCLDGEAQESPIGARERMSLIGPELREHYRRMDWDLPVEEVVGSGLTDSPRVYTPLSSDGRAAVDEALERARATHLRRKTFLRLSQGEGVRVLLARALANAPRVLFLDEAFEGLDAAARLALSPLWEELAESGVSLVASAHRPGDLPPALTHALWLSEGAIKAQGPRQEIVPPYFSRTRTPVAGATPAAAAAPGVPGPSGPLGPAGPAMSRAASASPSCAPAPAPDNAPSPQARPEVPLIRVQGVSVVLDGVAALRGVDFELWPGQHWAIMGQNGAGKSTLLKLLARDLRPAAGYGSVEFRVAGRVLRTLWEVRRMAGMVSWDLSAAFDPDMRAVEAVGTGLTGALALFGPLPTRVLARAGRTMEAMGLSELARRPLGGLSHGQRRAVFICRAMARSPRVLLLDEPFGGLDGRARLAMSALLVEAARQGTQLLAVTHHEEDIPAVATHVLSLENGRVAGVRVLRPHGEGPQASGGPGETSPPDSETRKRETIIS